MTEMRIEETDEILIGPARTIYKAAIHIIRRRRWTGDKMPIIKISDAKLDRYIGGIIAVENIYMFCTGEYTK